MNGFRDGNESQFRKPGAGEHQRYNQAAQVVSLLTLAVMKSLFLSPTQ
jgi:hypothetical protein